MPVLAVAVGYRISNLRRENDTKRIDVTKQGQKWVGQSNGATVSRGSTKAEAVKNTAKVAKADKEPVTVKIHKVDGKIQQERTYPGSADPKKSKG